MFPYISRTKAVGSRIVNQRRSFPSRTRGVVGFGVLAEATHLMQKRLGTRIGLKTPGTTSPSFQFPYHENVVRRMRAVTLQGSLPPDPTPGMNVRKSTR